MKFASKILAILAMAFAPLATMAADPLSGVSGYDPAEAGGGGLTASALNGSAYTITMTDVIGVSFSDIKGLVPMKKAKDIPTKKQVGLYALPTGTTIYAMGLGREWGSMPEELMQIDIATAKANGKLDGGKVSLAFVKGEERCRVVTWVAVLPDGQRAWASHPGGVWSTKNVNGSPMTGWCFKGTEVTKLDDGTKLALAKNK